MNKSKLTVIPDKPKLPFKNYLLDLVETKDGKNTSIYIRGVEDKIKEIWKEVSKKNWRKLNVRKLIPQTFGLSVATFYAYKNGKKPFSIQMLYQLLLMWQKFCKKSREEVEQMWEKIFKSEIIFAAYKGNRIILPKYLTPKLSYLIGWMCGDGWLGRDCIQIVESDLKQLKILRRIFLELFKLRVPIYKKSKNGYQLRVGCKPLFRFFKNVLKITTGRIPSIVYKMDYENKRYFLRGILDSEGYINDSYLNSVITISQSNILFLDKIKKLFKEYGINFRGPYLLQSQLGKWYVIRLRKKQEILKFSEKIGCSNLKKAKRLLNLVRKIEKNWSSRTTTSLGEMPKVVI
jgi:hypothetical protein